MLRNSREIIQRLEQDGFELVSVRGSHHKFRHGAVKRVVVVPHPRRDLPIRDGKVHLQAGRMGTGLRVGVTQYIALIHKEPGSVYGVSFPDVPGVVAAAESLDAAIKEAAEALAFAAEDWEQLTGTPFPSPRSLDALQNDSEFLLVAERAVVAAVPLSTRVGEAA